ncbi:hypothetical protein BU14_1073s0002 [Porphyra umbilicalis]|uniref:Uncharacterized protein n=1 Tax=Porphyra umbilicalis TaxID=2786 RepID=A0A1X6NMN8_PORUM|nr:hypothetical protein BU14_1073s0002 [Porphyra umbilicalis]|eukprot:OSX69845.1 hypothetical protein BU14_1073s0002 [Porphyra umbilicalis]
MYGQPGGFGGGGMYPGGGMMGPPPQGPPASSDGVAGAYGGYGAAAARRQWARRWARRWAPTGCTWRPRPTGHRSMRPSSTCVSTSRRNSSTLSSGTRRLLMAPPLVAPPPSPSSPARPASPARSCGSSGPLRTTPRPARWTGTPSSSPCGWLRSASGCRHLCQWPPVVCGPPPGAGHCAGAGAGGSPRAPVSVARRQRRHARRFSWTIEPAEAEKYDAFFANLDAKRTGYVTGRQRAPSSAAAASHGRYSSAFGSWPTCATTGGWTAPVPRRHPPW